MHLVPFYAEISISALSAAGISGVTSLAGSSTTAVDSELVESGVTFSLAFSVSKIELSKFYANGISLCFNWTL